MFCLKLKQVIPAVKVKKYKFYEQMWRRKAIWFLKHKIIFDYQFVVFIKLVRLNSNQKCKLLLFWKICISINVELKKEKKNTTKYLFKNYYQHRNKIETEIFSKRHDHTLCLFTHSTYIKQLAHISRSLFSTIDQNYRGKAS